MDKPVDVEGFSGNALAYVGAFLISFVGLVHLLQANEMFDIAGYLGILFLANFVAATVAAVGLGWTDRMWSWLLGDLVAGGAFVGIIVSRLFGLPGYPVAEASWFNLPGFTAFMLEGAFLSVSLLAITPQGRKLVKLEERSIELELSPEPLEKEIAGIRAGMALDFTDLRAHVRPKALKKRIFGNAWKRLPGLSKKSNKRKSVPRAAEIAGSHPLALVFLMAAILLMGRRIKR